MKYNYTKYNLGIYEGKNDKEIVKHFLGEDYTSMKNKNLAILAEMVRMGRDFSRITPSIKRKHLKVIAYIELNRLQHLYKFVDTYDFETVKLMLQSPLVCVTDNNNKYSYMPFLALVLNSGDYSYEQLQQMDIGKTKMFDDTILDVINPNMSLYTLKILFRLYRRLRKNRQQNVSITLFFKLVKEKELDGGRLAELSHMCDIVECSNKKEKLNIAKSDFEYELNINKLHIDDFDDKYSFHPHKELDKTYKAIYDDLSKEYENYKSGSEEIKVRPLFKYINK